MRKWERNIDKKWKEMKNNERTTACATRIRPWDGRHLEGCWNVALRPLFLWSTTRMPNLCLKHLPNFDWLWPSAQEITNWIILYWPHLAIRSANRPPKRAPHAAKTFPAGLCRECHICHASMERLSLSATFGNFRRQIPYFRISHAFKSFQISDPGLSQATKRDLTWKCCRHSLTASQPKVPRISASWWANPTESTIKMW